jgi:hypothetical protein
MSDEITPVMWQMLEEAATTYHFASIDLRYEGGLYIDWLNQLAALGYLDHDEDEHYGYSVSYRITDRGQQALAVYRRANLIPAPPDDLSIMDLDWLAYLAKGEYTQIALDNNEQGFVVKSLMALATKGYVVANSDAVAHHFALTARGKLAWADQHFRLHGKYPD